MARKQTTRKGAAKKSRARKSAAKPKGNKPATLREQRGQRALELRQQGLSWAEVGRKMKVSGSYARNCAADIVGGTGNLPPITH